MWLNKSAIVAMVGGFACFVSRFMFAYCDCEWVSWETICRSLCLYVHQSIAHCNIKSLSLTLRLHNLNICTMQCHLCGYINFLHRNNHFN